MAMGVAIKMVTVLLIFLPYKLSDFGRNASFTQDLLVAMVAFGLAYAIIALTGAEKKTEGEEAADRSRRGPADRW
jgi:hypothetical protein